MLTNCNTKPVLSFDRGLQNVDELQYQTSFIMELMCLSVNLFFTRSWLEVLFYSLILFRKVSFSMWPIHAHSIKYSAYSFSSNTYFYD